MSVSVAQCYLRVVLRWLHEHGEQRPLEAIPPADLDQHLCQMWGQVRKQDGTPYGSATLAKIRNTLSTYLLTMSGGQRYLDDGNYEQSNMCYNQLRQVAETPGACTSGNSREGQC